MNKLLNSVLDKVSENNNDYRKELRNLNTSIEEKTTTFVGDVVTSSNYVLDFSKTISDAKDMLITPIAKQLESYTIKDLRSVETVNEQFVEKINDKIENSDLKTEEDTKSFLDSLNKLLNEKYLEIVKIKRIPFINAEGVNENIEEIISKFVDTISANNEIDKEKLNNLINSYKTDLYLMISKSLEKISDLYLNNFVDEVSKSLNQNVVFDEPVSMESKVIEDTTDKEVEEYKPFIPDINPISKPEVEPEIDIDRVNEAISNIEKPLLVINEDTLPKLAEFVPPVLPSAKKKQEKEIEKVVEEAKPSEEVPKKTYDIDEILRIAKSPIVADVEETDKKDKVYDDVKPIEIESVKEESLFDEKQIVEEMIRRLTERLSEINKREIQLEEDEEQIKEDEVFVNDLIDSADNKKLELDNFEKELDAKEEELQNKEKELEDKLNSVMPFAKALMDNEN